MEYYRLKQPSDIPGTLVPNYPYASAIWSGNAPLFIRGSILGQGDAASFLPFYESTVLSKAFLVSSQVWGVWEELQKGGRSRPCAFGHMETRQVKPYRLVLPRVLEALCGDAQAVRLRKSRIGTNQVFAVKGPFSPILVVSGYVLEEMIRKQITGLSYDLVEMGGE